MLNTLEILNLQIVMLYRMTKDEECKIAYEEILQFIDRNICPPPDELPINVKVFKFCFRE